MKRIWLELMLTVIVISACGNPQVNYTDKLPPATRAWMLENRIFKPRQLADTAVTDVDSARTGSLGLWLVRRKGATCSTGLCGDLIVRDNRRKKLLFHRTFNLHRTRDLRIFYRKPAWTVVEYFDAPDEQSRYFLITDNKPQVYQTGRISALYLFKPEEIDTSRLTYSLFSLQEKIRLTKKWQPAR